MFPVHFCLLRLENDHRLVGRDEVPGGHALEVGGSETLEGGEEVVHGIGPPGDRDRFADGMSDRVGAAQRRGESVLQVRPDSVQASGIDGRPAGLGQGLGDSLPHRRQVGGGPNPGDDREQPRIAVRRGLGHEGHDLLLLEHQLPVKRAGLAEDGLLDRCQGGDVGICRVRRGHVITEVERGQGRHGPAHVGTSRLGLRRLGGNLHAGLAASPRTVVGLDE